MVLIMAWHWMGNKLLSEPMIIKFWPIQMRGLWCQKQVSQTGISNCIPQYSVGCNYLSMPKISAPGAKVPIYVISPSGIIFVTKYRNFVNLWWTHIDNYIIYIVIMSHTISSFIYIFQGTYPKDYILTLLSKIFQASFWDIFTLDLPECV